jgi:hypothetical protein
VRLKKIAAWGVAAIALIALCGTALYANALRKEDLTLLTSCMRVEKPAVAWTCKQAVYARGVTPAEAQELNAGIGVLHALSFSDPMEAKRLLELFIAGGVNVDSIDPETGWTALHTKVSDRYVEDIKLLLAHGARTDARDKKGRTPLQYAVELQDRHPHEAFGPVIAVLKAEEEKRSAQRPPQQFPAGK